MEVVGQQEILTQFEKDNILLGLSSIYTVIFQFK